MGGNGVLHNGLLVRPNSAETVINLADGDRIQISKHILGFSKVCASAMLEDLASHNAPASPVSVSRAQSPANSPLTPRRQSTRLRAKVESPRASTPSCSEELFPAADNLAQNTTHVDSRRTPSTPPSKEPEVEAPLTQTRKNYF